MKYRQRKKSNPSEGWSEFTPIKEFGADSGTLIFACEMKNVDYPVLFTILPKWLESCSVQGDVLRLKTTYLDVEIRLDVGETLENLNAAKCSIDSFIATSKNTILTRDKLAIVNSLEERYSLANTIRDKYLALIDQSKQQICQWSERVELALNLGEDDLAREAYSKKTSLEQECDLLRQKIKTTEELMNDIKVKIQQKKDSVPLDIPSNGNLVPNTQKKTVEAILQEINDLIGLENIKQEVRSLVNSLKVNQMRQSAGLPNVSVSRHMVFYGNPGTGKTTIARQLGELFCHLGILTKGHFVECDRSSLVGGYLGQTAIKTTQVLEGALGGILFIDEAYTLSQSERGDQYGQEAIDTLLKFMEDHRDEIVIIVAGYEDLMEKFLDSNPGLKSRFNKYFHFQDYSEVELTQIFLSIALESNYVLDKEAQDHFQQIAGEMLRIKTANFGNGRTVRNLFERSIANQANRIIHKNVTDKDDLAMLTKDDILREDMLSVSR